MSIKELENLKAEYEENKQILKNMHDRTTNKLKQKSLSNTYNKNSLWIKRINRRIMLLREQQA